MKLLVTDCTEEETANPLQNYQQQASESFVVNNNIHEIAPGKGLLTKKNSI